MAVYSAADRGFHALMDYDKDSTKVIKRDVIMQKLGLNEEREKVEHMKLNKIVFDNLKQRCKLNHNLNLLGELWTTIVDRMKPIENSQDVFKEQWRNLTSPMALEMDK